MTCGHNTANNMWVGLTVIVKLLSGAGKLYTGANHVEQTTGE